MGPDPDPGLSTCHAADRGSSGRTHDDMASSKELLGAKDPKQRC